MIFAQFALCNISRILHYGYGFVIMYMQKHDQIQNLPCFHQKQMQYILPDNQRQVQSCPTQQVTE